MTVCEGDQDTCPSWVLTNEQGLRLIFQKETCAHSRIEGYCWDALGPRTRRGPCYLVSGSAGAVWPRVPSSRWEVEANRKPDLGPIIYPTPHPGRPSLSEMGRRGIRLGSRASWEGGVSREIGSSGTVRADAALPHPSAPQSPGDLSGSLTGHGPRTGWAEGICVPRSHQRKPQNCAGLEASQPLKLSTVWGL